MNHMHHREAFKPIYPSKMTKQEKKNPINYLVLLTEKNYGKVKDITCDSSSIKTVWTYWEDVKTPTAAIERFLLTAVIDTKKERYVATIDITNSFVKIKSW